MKKETIIVNVYKYNFDNCNYVTSFRIKKYKRLIDVKKRLIDFIRLQQDEKHKKIRFYCFDLYHYQMKLKETDLNYIKY